MQNSELPISQEQKEDPRTIGNQQTLQALCKTHCTQRDKVKTRPRARFSYFIFFCVFS
ncbi:MAG: hypothetical protein UU40_C0003G0020 [Candidatus Uhrbacteria bacterium GW2011_GWD2_41_121]|uniref:Uncharacterized protein n=1 Tax=Candidatus Uhrbacteria bacterium GW2011_GWC1_41_20 TaxID=1618983 RepID=A0A0G0XS16_9BACT|nr:MAG: hypothetical protein UT52_C0003G0020 [Candidatus Uhrbacteria bacterium GW2011_GWE1_39_46]KKR64280.1 MAG: hypothetical protein UU04_C0003G0020 [Candidatus Uhrbacteria bacterium GW2011_GWC2_40_450]KKR90450.1 MAG: hypothetical protein UU40_C0003G0020 [Candidatus Uhrbacteria bacterium GW2011_GWD2_41_121]KKR96187.1 MAG: hypothetical protein UU46_C0006G0018 [Candidatus Uhrbacteria bacterium GW2011_GWD1_41_16]KKR99715.1 MAG: hypothetical protein UU50_C0003G0020 [Candidatus Uhrbacteria bacteriu